MSQVLRGIQERLSLPFPPEDHGFRPASVNGDSARALIYIDARNVMDRLDEVVGMNNWRDHYEINTDGVKCCLEIRIDGEWISREDFGAFSDQPDDGDKTKAAFSDALKRAAVKYGVGRYLYAIKLGYLPYDSKRKKFSDEDHVHRVTFNKIRELFSSKEKDKPMAQDTVDKIRGLLTRVTTTTEAKIVEAYSNSLKQQFKSLEDIPENCSSAIIERLNKLIQTEKKGDAK